ncbi:sensor histidine kinase [Bacteroidota bacterium]
MQEQPTYEELEKRYYEVIDKSKLKYRQPHDKLQSAFLNYFSHEIRTQMNSITGFADLLGNSNISKCDRLEYIENIRRSGKLLINAIDDNVNLAKIDIKEMKIHNTHFDINNFIDELEDEFIDDNSDKLKDAVKLKAHKESNKEFRIVLDKNKLKTIFTHFLNNAFKFTSKGTIEFGYRINSDVKLECFVKDSGVGISNNKLLRIKRMMESNNLITVDKFELKGQGLRIIRGCAELLDAEIIIESKAGEGTNVYFTLPFVFSTTKRFFG